MVTALVLALAAVAGTGTGDVSFVLPSGVRVRIAEAPFKAGECRVQGCGPEDKACLINGHVPFGTAFGLPQSFVKSIRVEYQGHTYGLDVSDMYDAWGGRPLEAKYKGQVAVRYFGGRCSDGSNCHFRGLFSDGAGSFVAEWQIVSGHPVRTVLTDSSDVMHLFTIDGNIDGPPDYQ